MIFGIDHVVLASTPEERGRIAAGLVGAGARERSFTLDFPESGVSSDSWSLAAGNYLEFAVELPGRRGPAMWFRAPTRVIGIGFSSDDFAADVAWPGEAERWDMDEELVLPDGRGHRIIAAGPHAHASPFYVFVMDRPGRRLDFTPEEMAPRLERVVLCGAEAADFGERLARWLGLPMRDGTLRIGDGELRVAGGEAPGVTASLELTGGLADRTHITLAAGEITIGSR